MIDFILLHSSSMVAVLAILLHIGGVIAAFDALFSVRTPQGALAWAIPLIFFPYGALLIYLVFGRRRFQGYRRLAKRMNESRRGISAGVNDKNKRAAGSLDDVFYKTLEKISGNYFVPGNALELLPDGALFFDSLLKAIREARESVSLCFYIVRSDEIGIALKNELLAARKRGVTVLFLYDELGSLFLPKSYVQELRDAGAMMVDFGTRQGRWNFFQMNFRNHRKIAIVDRRIAYVGGFNVGDEYVGRSRKPRGWRDTQVKVEGPAVADIEAVFQADWNWATQTTSQLQPIELSPVGVVPVLTVPTGAIDDTDRCLLFFLELINSAKQRLWIASPYFVPEDEILSALSLAAMRGVDVRLLIPKKNDSLLVAMAALYYISQVARYGVKIFRYNETFMHQKVWVVDSDLAIIGTTNMDSRSIRLSFEINLVAAEKDFVAKVSSMLEKDFTGSTIVADPSMEKLPFRLRLAASVARLFSPVL